MGWQAKPEGFFFLLKKRKEKLFRFFFALRKVGSKKI